MKIILLEDVQSLGKRGALVNVTDGYGRNFLIPKKLAVPATEGNIKSLEIASKKLKQIEVKEEMDAGKIKEELQKLSITIPMKAGEGDVLFGAVTSSDIAGHLEKEGFNIDKRKIELDEPIKRLGVYQVPVKLHRSINAEIKVWVVKE